jgi:hypothetical protein
MCLIFNVLNDCQKLDTARIKCMSNSVANRKITCLLSRLIGMFTHFQVLQRMSAIYSELGAVPVKGNCLA